MIGRRSLGYYEKLLESPNVKLVDLHEPSKAALKYAKLVVIIRGAIGLEAVISKIPVISLGKSEFQLLPPSMFRTCWNMYELPHVLREMMEQYRYDHEALVRYVASVVEGSTAVNLISDLLRKTGVFRTEIDDAGLAPKEHPHLNILADYLLKRIRAGSGSRDASMATTAVDPKP